MVLLSSKITAKLKKLSTSSGVYKFLDKKRKIIYVGKAKNLKKRVSTYFQKGRVRDNRLERLISEIYDVDIIETSSEAEALIFEAGLIKDYSPKFNIDLKDDKSYPYLKLTMNKEFPRLFITRRRVDDGATYYGPYANATLLKDAVAFIKKVFPLRNCKKFKKKVCLEYHIEQCLGPCENKISKKEYNNIVSNLKKFLEGKKENVIDRLQNEMKQYSSKKEYEKAIIIKQRIEALTSIRKFYNGTQKPMFGELDELQHVMGMKDMPIHIECFDVSNISGQDAVGSMVKFVGGKPKKTGYKKFKIKTKNSPDDYTMMREVVRRRYTRLVKEKKKLPDMILIDGGIGHLFSVKDELNKLGLRDMAVAAIAKEYNHLYVYPNKTPIRLSPGSRVLNLIQRIRDEAHRFAIFYHRNIRSKSSFLGTLREIKGIGLKKEKMLINRFGSIEAIGKADIKKLIGAGIDKKTAMDIIGAFKL